MNIKVRPNNLEGGITLISLIVMIILLVILAAVAIRGHTGNEGILGSTTATVERYSIEQYREKIAETMQKTILESATLGEEASIDDLKNNLNSAVDGLQTITMNDNISDVIVKTNEGYLFEAYFDEVFSDYYVEYMGQIDPSYIPEVNITYTEEAKEIKVEAKGNISKITITQNEKEVASGSNTILTCTATNSGIYKITVQTKEGITRYGYVNVGLKKEKLKAPEIKVAAGNEGNNGWYKTNVNVEIDPKETNGQTMKYRLTGAMKQDETPITNMADTTTIPVTGAGLTKVIAWVELEEEGKTYRSEYSYYNVKIDNVNPDAPTAKVTEADGNEVENQPSQITTYWYKTNVELEITANDDNSGIYGYTYSITGTKSVSETALIGKVQKITFETDGTYTLIIKAIDKAGNISTPYTITVYKDSTPPNQFTPNISNITNTGFTISAYTIDEASGIAKYEYYVNNEKKYEGTENTYTVSGLSKDTTYGVYVNAYDKAGNIQASSAISVYTAGSTSGGTTGGDVGGDGSTIGFGTYTITYDANLPEGVESTGLPQSRTFAHGETVTLTNDTPRAGAAGYNFLAWSTDKVAQETLYYPGSKITGYGNITLYAIWSDKCTISFNANGGDYTPTPQSFYSGGRIALPTSAGKYSDNESATLLGWAYTADNNYVYYLPGGVYDDYAYGTCTLYAVWDLGITVNIDTHGGTYANTHDDKVPLKFTFASGLGVNLPTDAGTYSNTNITHFKWGIGDANGNNMGAYWEGTSGAYFSDATANGKTLHAMWDTQIDFNRNGGTVDNPMQMLRYKESITLPSSAGTYTSSSIYVFKGWSTSNSAASGSTTYSNYVNGGTTTLYAVWRPTLNVGDYIDYQPNTATNATYSTTQDGAERSGYGSQTISRDTSLTWRVMSISGNTLTLIATTQSSSNLILHGQNGYNNGVKLLNDACNELYKNTTLGVTARSVKIEDINSLMGYTPSINSTDYMPSYKLYPEIFRYERWGSIDGTYRGSLGQSDQSSWYSGGGTASTLKGRPTYYIYTLSDYKAISTVQYAIATCQEGNSGSNSYTSYWFATRYTFYGGNTSTGDSWFSYGLFQGGGRSISVSDVTYGSGEGMSYPNDRVRPCVTVNLSSVAIGATGSGTSSSKYSISKR